MSVELDDVKKFFTDHIEDETVKSYLGELVPAPSVEQKPIGVEDVNQFLNTPEGKNLLQPMMDKRVTDALETYKKKTFEPEVNARVAAELLKRNPEESPAERRIRELEENQRRMDEERATEKLKNQIKELAFKEGIDPDFVNDIPFSSPEQAALYFRRFKQKIEEVKKEKANELLAIGGIKPGAGSGSGSAGKKDFRNMSLQEAIALEEAGEFDK